MRRVDRVCYGIAAALIGAGLLHLVVFLVDGGPWEGPVSWRKPVTFGLSFGITLATVTWVTSRLWMSPRRRAWLLGIFAADCVVEVAGITVQAWRGVPSHFNMETAESRAVAMMLAFGGAVLVVVLVAFALNAFRHGPDARAPAVARIAPNPGRGVGGRRLRTCDHSRNVLFIGPNRLTNRGQGHDVDPSTPTADPAR